VGTMRSAFVVAPGIVCAPFARNGELLTSPPHCGSGSTRIAAGDRYRAGLALFRRSEALVATIECSENSYLESIDLLSNTEIATELARSHLLYGEWLRRQMRRRDARRELQAAYDMLIEMSAGCFVERTAIELAATGALTKKSARDQSTNTSGIADCATRCLR
jgi:hypothetical protein